jgi:hypothetical protein
MLKDTSGSRPTESYNSSVAHKHRPDKSRVKRCGRLDTEMLRVVATSLRKMLRLK